MKQRHFEINDEGSVAIRQKQEHETRISNRAKVALKDNA